MFTNLPQRSPLAATELMSLMSAAGLVLLSGAVISLYSVLLHQAFVRTGSQDCVGNAAMFVANELRKTTVEDRAFGRVGLCDFDVAEGTDRKHITSLNRLYATLRLDDVVASRLNLPFMTRMVNSDVELVKSLDQNLRRKLFDKVRSDGKSPLFSQAYKLAGASNKTNERLVELRIKLGHLKSDEFDSGMPITRSDKAETEFSHKGNYKSGVNVPITANTSTVFYPLAQETRFVDAAAFSEANPDVTPSAVLVEALFHSASNGRQKADSIQTRRAVVLLGGADTSTPHSVLMISFPQGMPKPFHSLRALSSAACAETKATAWQQAADGNVPGEGHLTAAKNAFAAPPDMSAKDALQISIYHWLRSLGPTPNVNVISKMFEDSWAPLPVRPLDGNEQNAMLIGPNSALTKDTGARARAFYYHNGPGASGQNVLRAAFEGLPNAHFLPNSAMPLDIDEAGNCNLPGHTGFDRPLVSDLLRAIYDTNVIANESLAMAKSIINRMERAEDQVQKQINLTNEELTSISGRRQRMEGEETERKNQPAEVKLLRNTEAELTATINAHRAKLTEYQQVRARAETVMANAEAAAQASFDLCANMSKYAEDGVFRCEDDKSFLLGNVYIFRPIAQSVTEEQIYKGGPNINWLAQFSVLEPAPETIAIEGKLASAESASTQQNRALPHFILLDARELNNSNPRVLVLDRSPFSDTGVPTGQLTYYAENALTTGQNPTVGWSLLVRDAVAMRGYGGAPLASRRTNWCLGEDRAVSECPGLAVEIQIRSPIPLIPDLPVGSVIVSPTTHESVSQIPPMPENML